MANHWVLFSNGGQKPEKVANSRFYAMRQYYHPKVKDRTSQHLGASGTQFQ